MFYVIIMLFMLSTDMIGSDNTEQQKTEQQKQEDQEYANKYAALVEQIRQKREQSVSDVKNTQNNDQDQQQNNNQVQAEQQDKTKKKEKKKQQTQQFGGFLSDTEEPFASEEEAAEYVKYTKLGDDLFGHKTTSNGAVNSAMASSTSLLNSQLLHPGNENFQRYNAQKNWYVSSSEDGTDKEKSTEVQKLVDSDDDEQTNKK